MSIKSPGIGNVGPGGLTGFGNPSASVGAAAVNGSATTAMRSDAAPALAQPVEFAQGTDIASATTTNLETATGNVVDVTGTTTITAITLAQGHTRIVRFTGALTLTNGASLVLPGGANIVTVAGDYAVFTGYASSVVRCVGYFRNAVPYETGSFTVTLGGVDAVVTATALYTRIGNMVTLHVPSLTGTSNAATKTFSGIPAALRPAKVQNFFARVIDSVITSGVGYVLINTDGTADIGYFAPSTNAASSTTWTATGGFTLIRWDATYVLN